MFSIMSVAFVCGCFFKISLRKLNNCIAIFLFGEFLPNLKDPNFTKVKGPYCMNHTVWPYCMNHFWVAVKTANPRFFPLQFFSSKEMQDKNNFALAHALARKWQKCALALVLVKPVLELSRPINLRILLIE